MLRSTLLATLACAAAATAGAQSRSSRDQDRDYTSRLDTTYTFDRRGTVSLTLSSGEIIVNGWNRPEIRVRARSDRNEVRMDASAARLSLDLIRPRSGDTHYEVNVPVGVRVVARSTNGEINITGTRGGAEISTQNGDIVAEDVGDMLDAVTLSGDLNVRGVTGRVDIRTTSGEVTLSDVKGDVEITTVSGDIVMRDVVARYVRGKSTSGEVSYDGVIDSTGRYELGSHSGGVYLVIPPGTGAQVTVATYTGTIDTDFPITLRPGEHAVGAARRMTFEVGKGDARISAESFSGDITIRSKGRRPPQE